MCVSVCTCTSMCVCACACVYVYEYVCVCSLSSTSNWLLQPCMDRERSGGAPWRLPPRSRKVLAAAALYPFCFPQCSQQQDRLALQQWAEAACPARPSAVLKACFACHQQRAQLARPQCLNNSGCCTASSQHLAWPRCCDNSPCPPAMPALH